MCVTVLKQASVTMCVHAVWETDIRRAASRLLKWKAFSLVTKWGCSPVLITALLHPPLHSLLSSFCSSLLSPPSLSTTWVCLASHLSAAVSYCLSVDLSLSFVFSLSQTFSPPSLLSFPFLQPSLLKAFSSLFHFPSGISLSLHLTMSVFFSWLCLFFPLSLLRSLTSPVTWLCLFSYKYVVYGAVFIKCKQ